MTPIVSCNTNARPVQIDSSDKEGSLKMLAAQRSLIQDIFEINKQNIESKQYWMTTNDDTGTILVIKSGKDPFKLVDTTSFQRILNPFIQQYGDRIRALTPDKQRAFYKGIGDRQIEKMAAYLVREAIRIDKMIINIKKMDFPTDDLEDKLENLLHLVEAVSCFLESGKR